MKEGEQDPSLVKLEKVPLKPAASINTKNTETTQKESQNREENNAKSGADSTLPTPPLPDAVADNDAQAPLPEVSVNEEQGADFNPSFQEGIEEEIPVVEEETLTVDDLPEQRLIDEDSSEDEPKIVTAVAKG